MRRLLLAAVLAALMVMASAGAAFAGEVKGPGGNTEETAAPAHANSICAFSGLNDDPDDPEEGGRVQSWGQIPKEVRDNVLTPIGRHPGVACRGGSNPR
jgi:hypothetical protein